MEPETAERLLLSSLETPEHLIVLGRKYQLNSTNFPYYTDVAQFLWEYITEYGKAPNTELLLGEFPHFDVAPRQDFDHVAKVYADIHLTSQANTYFYTAQNLLSETPREAIPFLISRLQNLVHIEDQHQTVLDSRSTSERLEDYRSRRNGIGATNVFKTGVEPIDNFPVMLRRGQFVAILADTKVGKSWLALRIAAENYMAGRIVTIVSPELSLEELEMRSDVMMGRLMGYDLSYAALEIGQAGKQEETYEAFLKEWSGSNRKDWNVLNSLGTGSSVSVQDCATIARQTKADVLVVDGMPQLARPRDEKGWEGMEINARALKDIAIQQNCLVLTTQQLNREGAKDKGVPQAEHVAYSYGFNRELDLLLALGWDDISTVVRKIGVPFRRTGAPVTETFSISFDADRGDIGNQFVTEPTTFALDDFD